MEPVTHLLTGAVLSRAGFNRKSALATVTMTLAAEAPDLDILAYFKGSACGFMAHRGLSHTFLAVPVIAALVVGTVWLVDALWQQDRRERGLPEPPPRRWGWLYLFACIAGLSHLLLDFTNNYGVRPFFPFSRQWYAWDIVFIFEPLIFAVLLAALLLPWLFAVVVQENGERQNGPRGRAASIAALLLIVALWGVRDFEHRRALAVIDAVDLQGEPAIRTAAFPYMVNPFRWAGVAESSTAYLSMEVDSLHRKADSGNAEIYTKPQPTEATEAAQDSALGRAYMEWARFPLVEAEEVSDPEPGYLVHFLDVRFLYPEPHHPDTHPQLNPETPLEPHAQRRRRPLVAYVLLDSDLQPLAEGFDAP